MATASTLLTLTPLQWNFCSYSLLFCSVPQRKPHTGRLQIAVKCKHSNADFRSDFDRAEIRKNPFDQIAIQIKKALDSLKKPTIAAVLLGLLLYYDPNRALARSGGRIGGSSFSSGSGRSSSSCSIPSYSYSSSSSSSSSVSLSRDETSGGCKVWGGRYKNISMALRKKQTHPQRRVLTRTTRALLRLPEYCISCYSSVDVKPYTESGEQHFKNLSIEERGKFDEETLVNVEGVKRRSSKIGKASGFTNEYIVVTILVAAQGIHEMQPINGSVDLKKALKKLRSTPRNEILAVEVLWTPQDENEVLSDKELLEDYPLLKLL